MKYTKTKIVRYTPEQHLAWVKAAKKMKMNLTEFIRYAADVRS